MHLVRMTSCLNSQCQLITLSGNSVQDVIIASSYKVSQKHWLEIVLTLIRNSAATFKMSDLVYFDCVFDSVPIKQVR